ncbi:hypothetical protein ACMDCR_19335 [Labrys okinawensis]|uniref:hypothetical protein n=1 Tax=Labrys okinawensis TaxID=346911 RepID=UPI0039BCD32A
MQERKDTGNDARKFCIEDAQDWMGWAGFSLADVLTDDENPQAQLGAIGFTRARRGANSNFRFSNDEVLVVTSGSCSIHIRDTVLHAEAGQVIYLPAGTTGTIRADEDCDLVYVASSLRMEASRAVAA